MVQISLETARALGALTDDITTLDTRAGCSDAFFRKHFLLLASTARQTGALKELQEAIAAAEKPQEPKLTTTPSTQPAPKPPEPPKKEA